MDRLRALRPDAPMAQEDLDAAVAVCRRLDGLPLALELAATRAATLGIRGLVDRLDDALALLDGPDQRGLRGVLDWSYNLLAPSRRALLRTLAIFEGPFSLPMAEALVDGVEGADGRRGVAGGLADLVDLGLVGPPDAHDGAHRMLDLVRAYGREALDRSEGLTRSRRSHAVWAADFAREAAQRAVGPEDAAAFATVDRHRADLLAALRWSVQDAPDLAATIAGHLMAVSPFRTDVDLLAWARRVAEHPAVAELPDGPLARAAAARAAALTGDIGWAEGVVDGLLDVADPLTAYLAHHALGIVRLYGNDPAGGLAVVEAGMALAGVATAHRVDFHVTAGLITTYAGDRGRSATHVMAALALADAAGAGAYRAVAAYVEGERLVVEDPVAAVDPLRRAVDLADAVGAPFVWGIASTSLASALVRTGRSDQAGPLLRRLLRHWRQARSWPQVWITVRLTAELLASSGDHEGALVLLDAADHGAGATPVTGTDLQRHRAIRDRAGLDRDGQARVAALAGALSATQVVERAQAALVDVEGGPGGG